MDLSMQISNNALHWMLSSGRGGEEGWRGGTDIQWVQVASAEPFVPGALQADPDLSGFTEHIFTLQKNVGHQLMTDKWFG